MMIDGHVLRPIVEESIVRPHNSFFSRDVEVGKQAHVLFRWEENCEKNIPSFLMHACAGYHILMGVFNFLPSLRKAPPQIASYQMALQFYHTTVPNVYRGPVWFAAC